VRRTGARDGTPSRNAAAAQLHTLRSPTRPFDWTAFHEGISARLYQSRMKRLLTRGYDSRASCRREAKGLSIRPARRPLLASSEFLAIQEEKVEDPKIARHRAVHHCIKSECVPTGPSWMARAESRCGSNREQLRVDPSDDLPSHPDLTSCWIKKDLQSSIASSPATQSHRFTRGQSVSKDSHIWLSHSRQPNEDVHNEMDTLYLERFSKIVLRASLNGPML
jgi:hypothetical protein